MEVTSPFAARFEEVTLNPALPADVLCEAAPGVKLGNGWQNTLAQSYFITRILPGWGFSPGLSLADD